MAKTNAAAAEASPQFYIEEFLYRGRRKDDTRPTGWHIIIGVEGNDPLGRPYPPMPIMASGQAIEQGWDIPEILAEINAETLADLEAERASARTLSNQLSSAQAEVAQLRDQVAGLAAFIEAAQAREAAAAGQPTAEPA